MTRALSRIRLVHQQSSRACMVQHSRHGRPRLNVAFECSLRATTPTCRSTLKTANEDARTLRYSAHRTGLPRCFLSTCVVCERFLMYETNLVQVREERRRARRDTRSHACTPVHALMRARGFTHTHDQAIALLLEHMCSVCAHSVKQSAHSNDDGR